MDSDGAPHASAKALLPWLVAVAFFMQSLDITILNTAVPAIARALEVTPLSMRSVLASYALSLAIFIPISGWVADRFGTRRVFASAIGLFSLGSLLCGMATDIHMLVVSRVVQGCGGAMMLPVGRLTLVRTFGKSELVRAMSFIGIPGLVGPMIGPAAGGFIVHYLNWPAIFFLNIPIGLVGLVFVYLHLPDYRDRDVKPLDIVGLILFSAGIGLLSYVLEIFGETALGSVEVGALLVTSMGFLLGYWLYAKKTAYPLLKLHLFRIRTFAAAVGGGFLTRLGIGGVPFLLPLLYQEGLGLSPIQSGLLITPQAAAALSTKFVIPRLLERFGYRTVLISNTVLLGVLLALLATIGSGTPIWLIVMETFVYGMLTSTHYTSMNTLVYADIAPVDASSASSISSTMQQLSVSFGVAVAGLITTLFVPERLYPAPAEIIHGLEKAFLVLGGFTLLSAFVFNALKTTDDADGLREKDIDMD